MRLFVLVASLMGTAALTGAGERISSAQRAVEIPCEYRAGQIWLRVSAEGSDRPLNFLLDSGATVSVLDQRTAKLLGVALGDPVKVCGVRAKTVAHWTKPLSVDLTGFRHRGKFLTMDLSKLSQASGREIDGLMGADFFRDRVVQIDYRAQTLRVLASAHRDEQSELLPLRTRRGAMEVPIRVDGSRPRWVRLDTGCASALQWAGSGARPANAAAQVSIGLSEVTIPVAPASVHIGTEHFASVPTGWHAQQIFPGEAGLLGNGLLSRFKVTVDAPARRLILERYRNP